jgi:nucleotide-binding universal stress UspA family protein
MYRTIVVHIGGDAQDSRVREWVLGGVSRALLDRAPAPLLIAH